MNPRKVDLLSLMRALPQIAVQFQRKIPDEFWTLAGDDEVTVCCPCGHSPDATRMLPVQCDCDRWFLYDGDVVRVARYPAADAAEV